MTKRPSRPASFVKPDEAHPVTSALRRSADKILGYARPGPGRRDRMSVAEREHIIRTVRRAPEVMVKVLSKGGQDLRAIRRHIDYLRFRDEGELAGCRRPGGQRALQF